MARLAAAHQVNTDAVEQEAPSAWGLQALTAERRRLRLSLLPKAEQHVRAARQKLVAQSQQGPGARMRLPPGQRAHRSPILHGDIVVHGATPGCKGHTEQCRSRFRPLLQQTAAGKRRLHESVARRVVALRRRQASAQALGAQWQADGCGSSESS